MSWLDDLDDATSDAVAHVHRAAHTSGANAWLVGGFVRDLLLGSTTSDLDFAVSTGSEEIAKQVAEKIGGRVIEHPRFMTATIETDDLVLDFANTRSEKYPGTGELPVVHPAALEQDLLRRDFTINAMAIDLAAPDQVIDHHGGRTDLEKRLIRALHSKSFEDDPTRIDRGVRFATRLGFEIEEETSRLIEQSISDGARDRVSARRLFRELELVFAESKAGETLRRLAALGALRRFSIARISETRASAIDTIASLVASDHARFDSRAALLGMIVPASAVDQVGRESGLPQSTIRKIHEISSSIETGRSPSRDLESPELELALRAIETSGRFPLEEYKNAWERHERTSLPFAGDELHPERGPHLSRAIRDTREALAWGEISPSDAHAFAQRRALRYFIDR